MRTWLSIVTFALATSCDPAATPRDGTAIDAARDAASIDRRPASDGGTRDTPASRDGNVVDRAFADSTAADRTAHDSAVPDSARPDGALAPCEAIAGEVYASLAIQGSPSDRVPAQHADLNVKLRGWEPTSGTLGLIDLAGDTDLPAPKLYSLFVDDRVPTFVRNYRVYDWDWGCNCRGAVVTDWEATLTGFAVTPGEVIECPRSGYDIGGNNAAMVLFVDDDSITLKYTPEDNVVLGYTIHLVGICVEPSLRARYQANRAAGTSELPVLRPDQPLGRARGNELIAAIRDTGSFMDPRSRKDWW